jgi:hypothetical protein
VIGCVPVVNVEVTNVAFPPLNVPVPICVPLSKNVTVPVIVPAVAEVTVAVNVTLAPAVEGFNDDATEAVVAAFPAPLITKVTPVAVTDPE